MLFPNLTFWQNILIVVGFVGLVAYAAAEAVARLARLGFVKLMGEPGIDLTAPLVRRPIRLIRATVFALILFVLTPPALKAAGVRLPYGLEADAVARWVFHSGLRIGLVIIIAVLFVRVATVLIRRFEEAVSQGEGLEFLERAKRARTLGAAVESVIVVLVAGVALLTVLRELDVDIRPVLTAAGIGGLAIGFGAQTLVKDVISGFFLLLENQVRVGDVAVINGTGGLVEAINLRTIVLRDLEGVVHVFPNGAISSLSNRTRDFSYAVLDIGVAYKEDVDRVMGLLRQVGDDLRADPVMGPSILEPLEMLGVDAFADSQVILKLRIKTVPLKQWEVARELRRRIKKAFDAAGIEIPFPHRTIYWGEASKPWKIAMHADGP